MERFGSLESSCAFAAVCAFNSRDRGENTRYRKTRCEVEVKLKSSQVRVSARQIKVKVTVSQGFARST